MDLMGGHGILKRCQEIHTILSFKKKTHINSFTGVKKFTQSSLSRRKLTSILSQFQKMDHQNVGHHQVDQNLRPIVEPYLPQNPHFNQAVPLIGQNLMPIIVYQPYHIPLAVPLIGQNLMPIIVYQPYHIPLAVPLIGQNLMPIIVYQPYHIPLESQNLNPMAQPYFPQPYHIPLAESQNLNPMAQPYLGSENIPGPSHAQTQAGPSQPQNEKPRGLPHVPAGRDYVIKPGHMFSKRYEDLFPEQYKDCANCRPNNNHFSFRANLVQPEDICVRCLVAVGHWSKDLYADYIDVKKQNSAFSAHSKITYKTELCKFHPNCNEGVDCVNAHGEADRRVNQLELNPHVLAAVMSVVEDDNPE
ncbi:uncharacterized protein LOC123897183 isoform X2 [Trifolium pratense]|nr:uncharacterized protein LOC123897127 isoform X2 [Trifolium pratense]XP_045803666.1 uncharacterized protein LOC123897183 isoform X2 [Trifolium pratense]